MQIKMPVRYHCPPIRTAKIKNLTIASADEEAEKQEHLNFSYKGKPKLTIWPLKDFYANVHSKFYS